MGCGSAMTIPHAPVSSSHTKSLLASPTSSKEAAMVGVAGGCERVCECAASVVGPRAPACSLERRFPRSPPRTSGADGQPADRRGEVAEAVGLGVRTARCPAGVSHVREGGGPPEAARLGGTWHAMRVTFSRGSASAGGGLEGGSKAVEVVAGPTHRITTFARWYAWPETAANARSSVARRTILAIGLVWCDVA